MTSKFAKGTQALGICDRCGLTYKMSKLNFQRENREKTNLLVCPECLDEDHPQYWLSQVEVDDPRPVRDQRLDTVVEPNNTGNFTSWEFGVDAGDWMLSNATAVVSGGEFLMTATGSDPMMVRETALGNQLALTASDYNYLRIGVNRPSAEVTWDFRFQWQRDTDSTWDASTGRVKTLLGPEFKGSELKRELVIYLDDLIDWDGTIEQLRIRYHTDTTLAVGIDYIRFNEF
jgi:hypothetical protein